MKVERRLIWIINFLLGAVNLYIFANYAAIAPYANSHGHRGTINLIIGVALLSLGLFQATK